MEENGNIYRSNKEQNKEQNQVLLWVIFQTRIGKKTQIFLKYLFRNISELSNNLLFFSLKKNILFFSYSFTVILFLFDEERKHGISEHSKHFVVFGYSLSRVIFFFHII